MNQQLVIPERCAKCGNVFDLSYDFSEDGQSPKEFLCWYCRDKEGEVKKVDKGAIGEDSNWLSENILEDEDYPEG